MLHLLCRSFLLVAFLFGSLAAADRPNVLFITVDDMNRDSVGAYGCPIPDITPNIDRLASEGIKFQQAHVTIAICQPTRAVWMTGRYPHRNGAVGFNPIHPGVPTLLETLHEAGYYTGIMAKVPHVVPTRGKAWDYVVPANELKTGRDPELYYDRATEFFSSVNRDQKPFFLMANSQDPHRPFANSDRERQRKQNNKYPGVSRTFEPEEIPLPDFLPDLPDIRTELTHYFASVHRADEIVGSVLRALDDSGLRESTLVVFMSDHGMPLPFAKTNCWRESTITPWIVRWPGVVSPGSVDDEHLISGIDFTPTILDAAGLPPLDGVDGRSILPLLRCEPQRGREFVFTSINTTAGKNNYPMRSIQSKRFGYIFNGWSDGTKVFKNESQAGLTMKAMRRAAEDDPAIAARVRHFLYRTKEEFYDYANDPAALHNLIDDPCWQPTIAEYRDRLRQQMEETSDHVLEQFTQQ